MRRRKKQLEKKRLIRLAFNVICDKADICKKKKCKHKVEHEFLYDGTCKRLCEIHSRKKCWIGIQGQKKKDMVSFWHNEHNMLLTECMER